MSEIKKIRSFKAFNIPAPFTETLGSVQKIGDDYLISGGSANYAMLINSKTGKKKMELKANQSLYRAYLITDLRGTELTNETTNR